MMRDMGKFSSFLPTGWFISGGEKITPRHVGDGVRDGGEAAQGADPLDPDDVPSCEWFTLTGDLEQDAVKTLERTFRIPAGQSRLAVVALHSDEYPEYTGDSSQYNDILTWEVTPASGPPVSGSVDVNSRHAAWGDGIALNGFSPVCVEVFHALAAPPGAPMTVTVRLTAKNISDSILPSTVMVGVMNARFIDKTPNYALEQGADSDNFFLREKDGSGNPDHENLDIYYSLGLPGLPVSDVKIKVYKGESSTPELVLDGVKDADGNYRTGDNLHTNWTASVDLAEDHPGFYRLQLSVSVEGQGAPVLETSIADADGATPGWQCPQDCLAVHDLVWKHRPIIHCHPDDLGRPSNLDRFLANVGGHTKEPAGNAIITNTPPAMPGTVNTFYDLFDDNRATIGDLSEFTAAQRTNVLSTAAGAETLYHTAVPPGGTGGAPTHTFLQYWMFYNFSTRMFGLPIVYDSGLPDVQHEGDVEHCQIAVRLKDPARPAKKAAWITPFGATASQHYYAQTLRWDLNDGSAAANSHVQTHVEHQNNRLVVYVARGAHATYFVADNEIPVPVFASRYLGTQTMYDATARSIHDVTVANVQPYELHEMTSLLKSFVGRFGYHNPALTGLAANENGPAGLPHRAARISATQELNLRNNARELHNRAIRTVPPDQTAEMTIQP